MNTFHEMLLYFIRGVPMDRVVNLMGMKWYVPHDYVLPFVGRLTIPFGFLPLFEATQRNWIRQNVPKGGVFVDIGAAFGLYSHTFANHFDMVYAIEPHPVNRFILGENIRLNGLNNVQVIPYAVWDSHTEIRLGHLIENDYFRVGIQENQIEGIHTFDEVHIPTIRLDDVCLAPDFIKMDIEGGEYMAIRGMEETLSTYRPLLMVEVHEFQHPAKDFFEIMGALGYRRIYSHWTSHVFAPDRRPQ